jgi:hypothetical protein
MKNKLQVVIFLLVVGISTERSHGQGQVNLTGLLQSGTGANGQTVGSPIWTTVGNETNYAVLYLAQPNAGYTAPLMNSGDGFTKQGRSGNTGWNGS